MLTGNEDKKIASIIVAFHGYMNAHKQKLYEFYHYNSKNVLLLMCVEIGTKIGEPLNALSEGWRSGKFRYF